MSASEVLLDIKGLTKDYPGVRALDNVDFNVIKGEIHVLVGENGAGKSTLVKFLSGAIDATELESMNFEGKDLRFGSPRDSIDAGIAGVQQHFSLIQDMTVAENIFLGDYPSKGFRVDKDEMNKKAKALLEEVGVNIEPIWRLGDLAPGDQQVVEICKAIARNPKLLMMDEPTSGLKYEEIERLFTVIKKLQSRGVTIIYISHRLEEVFEIGERVTVLRNGQKVAEEKLSELSHEQLTQHIIGREIDNKYPKEEATIGDVVLKVENLSNSNVKVPLKNISFELREGEILAVYGILGSGKDELADTLFGLNEKTGGSIRYFDEEITVHSPGDAIKKGIGYLTEDRHRNGFIQDMTVRQNMTLAALKRFCTRGHIRQKEEIEECLHYKDELDIRVPSIETTIKNLSGGNQQKVVFAKWLVSKSKVLLLNELTKGIDIGAKVEMFRLMVKQAQAGAAILYFSSELEEVVSMADRIIVMRNGEVAVHYNRDEFAKDQCLMEATKRTGVGLEPADVC